MNVKFTVKFVIYYFSPKKVNPLSLYGGEECLDPIPKELRNHSNHFLKKPKNTCKKTKYSVEHNLDDKFNNQL